MSGKNTKEGANPSEAFHQTPLAGAIPAFPSPNMKDSFIYFSDTESGPLELCSNSMPMPNAEFAAKFPGVKGMKFDSFAKRVAPLINGKWTELYPVTRVIRYKKNPSLHECNGRCMGGNPNGTCECRCGGKNHGRAGVIFSMAPAECI